jgi:tetratricopeptide (TPR) repeat protein
MRVSRETALYGRDAELGTLAAAWERAKAGDGRVVLVTGEAGVGKTRLVDEFTTRVQREGDEVHVLFGAYPPGGAATEVGAFATAFREHFGAEGLEARLAPYLTVTPLLVPAFAAMLRGEPTPAGQEPLTKDSLQTVFVHALRALAAERPTVLLIDELHFAPEEGRALFAALALAAPGHRVLLLGTARRGVPEEWLASLERLEHVTQTGLGRLGPRALQELLADALRSERLAEDVSARIAVKSDGNPFFVFEILGDLRERGVLERRPDGAWSTTSEIRDIRIPSTVKDLIRTRLEGLEGDDRDLLDVAAVAGYEFDAVLVGDALGLGRIPTLKRLARIERHSRLVRSAGERYVFDHPQVQEALYAGLAAPLAREYHAALGDALERNSGAAAAKRAEEVDEEVVLGLADHFLKGGQGARARRWLGPALGVLERRQLADPAAETAGRALATKGLLAGRDRAEVLLRRAEQLEVLGRREEEREGLEEAVRLADEAGDFALAARAHRALGSHSWAVSRYDEARTRLEEARTLAARGGDRVEEVRAMVALGEVLRSQGRYEDASRLLTESLQRAREVGDHGLEAQAATSLAAMARNLGRYVEAERHLLEALETARAAGDRRNEASALATLGIVLGHLGRYEESRRHLEAALATARAIGDRHTEGLATGNLGLVFASLGRLDRALEHPERWLAIAREIGDRNCEGNAAGSLGLALKEAGRVEEARAQHERHLEIAKEIGDRLGREHATYALGLLADLEGRADDAERLLEAVVALQRESGHRRGLAYSLLALGRLLASRGRVDPAREALEGARVLARMMGLAGPQALAAVHLALLPGGDVADAKATVAAHEERLTHAERLEARFLLFRATRERAHLEEAHRLLLVLRDGTPRNLRDAMYGGSPLRREVLAAWKETRATQA